MKIEFWQHICDETGKCVDGGSVGVLSEVKVGNGCGLPNCHCSDGYWLMMTEGFFNGAVRGATCRFDDKAEFDRFVADIEAI